MPRILVQPEYLRECSALLRQSASELQSIASHLGGALGGLAWEARRAAGVEGEWQHARSLAVHLATHAESLARYLDAKAQAFEQADYTSAANLAQVLGTFTQAQHSSLTWWTRFPARQLFPHVHPAYFLLNVGKRMEEILLTPLAGFTGLLGSLIVGTRFLRLVSPHWQNRLEQTIVNHPIAKGGLTRAEQQGFERASAASPSAILNQAFRLRNGSMVAARDLDGRTPLAGLDSTYGKPGQFPLKAPITSVPGERHPKLTEAVINQFGVETNPRYTRDTYTYCNTFASDYARAMGVPLPTKAEQGVKGDPAPLAAEPLYRWLINQSHERGWREVDPTTPHGLRVLLEHVNAGKPALATDPGHIAVIRPNQGNNVLSVKDIRIAQAGAQNVNDIRLGDAGLGTTFNPRYFVHD